MDISNLNSGGGAVACPVCTLYLREGISLQRHLDTHPKEQVIEALIKASSSSVQTQQAQLPSTPLSSSSVQPLQNSPQIAPNTTPLSPQSPYPIGPIFECPTIGTVMSPQFTSFSYQQFVNNGTVMIPQYAMAPQANQMMQMLYNPYGLYQQQQIPTMQMISPVTTVSGTTRHRTTLTIANETTGRPTITVPISNTEPKQILPEILPEMEHEPEHLLSDMNAGTSPSLNETGTVQSHDNESNIVQVEPQEHSTHNTDVQEQCTIQSAYNPIPTSLAITCSIRSETTDKVESVLPDIDDLQSPTEKTVKSPQCKEPETENYVTVYKDCPNKVVSNEVSSNLNKSNVEEEMITVEDKPSHEEERTESNVTTPKGPSAPVREKESAQPEVEQLERLLITIMESEFRSTLPPNDVNANQNKTPDTELQEKFEIEKEDVIPQIPVASIVDNDEHACDISTSEEKVPQEVESSKSNGEEKVDDYIYKYKHSLSAPASPFIQRRAFRSYSVRSELGSTENLYPLGFDASMFHDEEDDEDEENDDDEIDDTDDLNDNNDSEKHDMDDNLDEADMEIEDIPSPHTPLIKCGDNTEYIRSHTPLSVSSGVSVLRVRKDLSKPCSPASVQSFCHVDTNGINENEGSNNGHDESLEKKPIDDVDKESHDVVYDNITVNCTEIDKKPESHTAYHQSVIIEHTTVHSQQSTSLHDPYSAVTTGKTESISNFTNSIEVTSNTDIKGSPYTKPVVQKQSLEVLSLNEDAHAGPMNVFEFDGLQILVPSTFINESSQKAVSATSQQSMASSEGGVGIDEEVKSVSMRADETMPPRGELSEQESNGCTEQSAWQLYMGQESSRMSTSYDLMARESWEESEGSDNEISNPLLDSRSLATHFTSSLFLDRDRKTPTKRTFKCYHCPEVFDCPKERRVHSTTAHKEAGPSSSREPVDQGEVKDIKLLDGRVNIFEDIFVPGLHVQQIYHHQQPLLHQLQPAQSSELTKLESDPKIENLAIQSNSEITCGMCNQRFSGEKLLQQHQRRVHVTEPPKRMREICKCQICNEEFSSILLFNTHLKIHPLECGQCGKYFHRKQNFKLHMKRHLGIKPFPCTVCDKAFLTKQKLDEHMNGHTGNAPVKCNLCNETFRRYSNLTQHKNRHHLNIKRKLKDYVCHCGEVFHTKKKLAWHKETHDDKPKACTYCNERFIHMASLTRHMRRAHNRRFVPDAQRENENVECPICKCIYLRSSLAVHMRVHNGERPYECQICSKAFSTKWNLQLHKWTHAARSTKPFKCNQCSAAFYRHSDYTAHMNSHRNVRPYTCNYCGAQFIRKYNCLRHVKEHEENKAYTCDVCNKTFHRSYYLKEHLRVHSGARPYTCHICGKSSGTKSNHNKHVRIHHAREPVNTEN